MNPFSRWLSDARSAPDTRYVDTCDGIRVLAILLVGWFHIWQQSWLYPGLTLFGQRISFDPLVRSGYIWVDVMILISGFCLYLPWARLPAHGAQFPDAFAFYARRLRRVEPSYLLTITCMLLVALARGQFATPADAAHDYVAHLTYTQTFSYDTYYATKLGGALWTLAIEMQFYLLFPALARAFYHAPAVTFAGMCSVSLLFRAYVGVAYTDIALYFNQLPAYLDVFACGILAARAHVWLARQKHGPLLRLLCSALSLVALGGLLSLARAQSGCGSIEAIRLGQMQRRLGMGLWGGLLLVASANAGLVLRSVLGNRLTRFLSSISMQFYIWHQTLAVWLREARVVPSALENPNYDGDLLWQLRYTALCFGLSLLLAAVLTYGFERPVARALERRAARRKARHTIQENSNR